MRTSIIAAHRCGETIGIDCEREGVSHAFPLSSYLVALTGIGTAVSEDIPMVVGVSDEF